MRDPNRIPVILAEIEKLWAQVPDWRLGQLTMNAVGGDPFYVEDSQLVNMMRELIEPPAEPEPPAQP